MHNLINRINEIRIILTDLESIAKSRNKSSNYKSCLTCKAWNTENNLCITWNVLPPPNIIVLTCDKYQEVELPF